MISLKQIRYALAVEKNLHFKRAAQECSVSQSALSTALAEMERQLGVKLFERDNKKVLVTPVGRLLLDKARQIKLAVDDLQALAEQAREPMRSQLNVGMIPTVGPFLLPVLLPELEANHPQLKLHVTEAQSEELIALLRGGELDTAILALPYPHPGLLSFAFWRENFYWVTHKDDAYAHKRRIAADELDPDRLMLLKEGHCLSEHVLAACKLERSTAHGFQATSLLTLVQMAAGKMGTTLVPEMALAELIAPNANLVSVPLSEPGPHRELAFLVRPGYPALASIERLLALLQKALRARRRRQAHPE